MSFLSHYSVLVLSDEDTEVDGLLAPFNENISVEPYIKYTKEELIANEKEEIKRYKNRVYAKFKADPEGYKEKHKDNLEHLKYVEFEFPKRLHWTNARIYKEAIRFYSPEEITEDGSIISTYNPESKWDWYVKGGRFSGMLRLKVPEGVDPKEFYDENGEYTDSAYADEIDFSPNEEEYKRAIRFWELFIEDDTPKNEEEVEMKNCFYAKEYFLNRYSSKEDYAHKISRFTTWAVLTPDGIWNEPGQMGWFGCHSATMEEEIEFFNNYDKFIEEAQENNWLMTVVDCHI